MSTPAGLPWRPEDAYIEGTLAIYEQRRVDLLRDVFLFAYERSSSRYRVVRESLGQPNPLRLRYRTELANLVLQTVRANEAPGMSLLRKRGEALDVPGDDLDEFSNIAVDIMLGLHEGSAARYGLTPREFREWKAQFEHASQSARHHVASRATR